MLSENSTTIISVYPIGECPFGNEKSMCSAYTERKEVACSNCMKAFEENVPAQASSK